MVVVMLTWCRHSLRASGRVKLKASWLGVRFTFVLGPVKTNVGAGLVLGMVSSLYHAPISDPGPTPPLAGVKVLRKNTFSGMFSGMSAQRASWAGSGTGGP